MAVFAELRRRNVLKVALLYVVASWLLLWFVRNTGEAIGLPVWAETFFLLLLAFGLPVALLFAWTYEITPAGLKKSVDVEQTQSIVYKTGQKLNAAVAVLAGARPAGVDRRRADAQIRVPHRSRFWAARRRCAHISQDTSGNPPPGTRQRSRDHRLA